MRIQHNIAALNSYRNLGINNSGVAKNLEKLSSGYRINRAGDDAAGLAISEKMRSQITGLNTATKNANDGISLVQTAEGALTEVHSMLNRMVEIATQSANGVYEDGVDRQALQDEMTSLKSEIDRISQGTNFNKKNLLDGGISDKLSYSFSGAATTNTAGIDLNIDISSLQSDGKTDLAVGDIKFVSTNTATEKIEVADGGAITITVNGDKDYSAADIKKLLMEKTATGDGASDEVKAALKKADVVGKGISKATSAAEASKTVKETTKPTAVNDAMSLQIGDTSKDFNQLKVSVRKMDSASLGLANVKVDSEKEAGIAVDAINAAINKVSTQRGELGAIQNRLEHTINNLSVNAENMTAAESRIRDVDMADEMMKYTKNNILVQASQAMLAQANQVPQGVLQLLQ